PSDHVIHDDDAFANTLQIALEGAQSGEIVTLGIKPDRPETGYGYIRLEERLEKCDRAKRFTAFVEKPSIQSAEDFVASGDYLWNAGIFIGKVSSFVKAFERFASETLGHVRNAVEEGHRDLDFFRLSDAYNRSEKLSFDHQIMEHLEGGWVIPFIGGWNDLGAWKTVWSETKSGENQNAVFGDVTTIDTQNCLLRAEDERVHIAGVGLDGIAVVAMRDAVLVAQLDQAQGIGEAVREMKARNVTQATEFPRAARPWGNYETLMKRDRFHVKEIVVKPEQILSLQSHVHRAEHWVVVAGTARVTIGDEVTMVSENQSVYIPLGEKHRLENPGKVDLHIVEVQTGAYLEEDDIVRYEDVYARIKD
ncbi:UNVERIFIED_CONTAM: hypothetical protein GTU68_052406, partial [Idotea baltica]|nr:hypothetical protein [Idotea baltica]